MGLVEAARKTFEVQRYSTVQTDEGWRQDWLRVGELVGVLTSATTNELMRSDQQSFDTTHRIVQKGAPVARLKDRLLLNGRYFYVEAVDNLAEMDRWTMYICEERR